MLRPSLRHGFSFLFVFNLKSLKFNENHIRLVLLQCNAKAKCCMLQCLTLKCVRDTQWSKFCKSSVLKGYDSQGLTLEMCKIFGRASNAQSCMKNCNWRKPITLPKKSIWNELTEITFQNGISLQILIFFISEHIHFQCQNAFFLFFSTFIWGICLIMFMLCINIQSFGTTVILYLF